MTQYIATFLVILAELLNGHDYHICAETITSAQ